MASDRRATAAHRALNAGIRQGWLLRIAWRESRFGLGVGTPEHGEGVLGLTKRAFPHVRRRDPAENIAAGARWLKKLLKQYGSEAKAECVYGRGQRACGL